jgi:hypothetical protein
VRYLPPCSIRDLYRFGLSKLQDAWVAAQRSTTSQPSERSGVISSVWLVVFLCWFAGHAPWKFRRQGITRVAPHKRMLSMGPSRACTRRSGTRSSAYGQSLTSPIATIARDSSKTLLTARRAPLHFSYEMFRAHNLSLQNNEIQIMSPQCVQHVSSHTMRAQKRSRS